MRGRYYLSTDIYRGSVRGLLDDFAEIFQTFTSIHHLTFTDSILRYFEVPSAFCLGLPHGLVSRCPNLKSLTLYVDVHNLSFWGRSRQFELNTVEDFKDSWRFNKLFEHPGSFKLHVIRVSKMYPLPMIDLGRLTLYLRNFFTALHEQASPNGDRISIVAHYREPEYSSLGLW